MTSSESRPATGALACWSPKHAGYGTSRRLAVRWWRTFDWSSQSMRNIRRRWPAQRLGRLQHLPRAVGSGRGAALNAGGLFHTTRLKKQLGVLSEVLCSSDVGNL